MDNGSGFSWIKLLSCHKPNYHKALAVTLQLTMVAANLQGTGGSLTREILQIFNMKLIVRHSVVSCTAKLLILPMCVCITLVLYCIYIYVNICAI